MANETLSGRCLCGRVTFTAVPKGAMSACHCGMCRRMSGGVFLAVECEGDVAVEGPVKTYDSSAWAVRQFCGECGSTLFWRTKAGDAVSVSIQAFEDPSAFAFESEIYIDAKPSSYAFSGERPRLTEAEVLAQFGGQD